MIIHLVRHAETIWHSEDRYAGHTDIELSRNGEAQTEKLAIWAKNQNISRVITSALSRSINTAKPTAINLGIESSIDPRFNEVNFGLVEGLTKLEFKNNFPQIWEQFQIKPATTAMPSGESGRIALDNALAALYEVINSDDKREVLIVSHGTLIRLILCSLLNRDINEYRKLFPKLDNIAITTISINLKHTFKNDTENFQLIRFNQDLKYLK